MDRLIANKYAKALLNGDENKLDLYIDELTKISSAIEDDNIKEMINSPMVKRADKTRWIVEALGDGTDDVVIRLVEMMGENDRLALIPQVAKILNLEYKKKRNLYQGTVESSNELDGLDIAKLEDALSKYSGAMIKLEPKKSDFNGIKAEVEDLGLELNFSKDRVKNSLLDYIQKAL